MTLGEFKRLARAMRQAQKEYFRSRSAESLELSKELETKFDAALNESMSRETDLKKPVDLFGVEIDEKTLREASQQMVHEMDQFLLGELSKILFKSASAEPKHNGPTIDVQARVVVEPARLPKP